MNSRATLIIFAKAPVPGTVKTRLIKTLGPQGAVDLHKQLTTHCIEMAMQSSRYKINLWCAPTPSHVFFEQLSAKYSFELKQQEGDNLGQRMAHALEYTLLSNEIAIIIGSDCPVLTHRDLELIIQKLEDNYDAAIIPAEDGGYVLLGLRNFSLTLFQDIEWGGKDVFKKTKKRMQALDWNCYEHETLWDVDRPNDLERLKSLDSNFIGNF